MLQIYHPQLLLEQINVAKQFDNISNIHKQTSAHSDPKIQKDLCQIVNQLHNVHKVFKFTPRRRHHSFQSMKGSIVSPIKADKDTLLGWMKSLLKPRYCQI